ncbi:hypothetical protein CTRI78_v008981 [Colletotrichum trifolii]|uniref:Rhodopsin domain-containing protein n=1 Tax=Colletotrichum trifolii TaxID=5466 RepID=A0A4R8QRV4_COLTR|nr:hypothetical protein CTRI78_v008981 [Colletotrichum trifolii]
MAAPPSPPSTKPMMGGGIAIFPLEKQTQISVVSVSIAFIVLPTTMVILRLISKRLTHRGVDASDYCIVAACAISIVSVVQCGVGLHNFEIIPKFGYGPIVKFLKVLVAQQLLWAISLSLCKIAILLLYARIFTTRGMVLFTRTVAGFIMMWTVVVISIAFFICRPLSDHWSLDLKNRSCGNQTAADSTMGFLNIITDVAVLLMPVSRLWRLRIEIYKKMALVVAFSLGILTCIASALRLYYLAKLEYFDVTFNIPNALIFSALEPGVGITLACIPFLRPLLDRSRYSSNGTAGYCSSNGNSKRLASDGRQSNGFVLVEENSVQLQLQ